jgi:two-component system cell cycle sensor histidine kinase/response regulator CckA
MRSSDHDEPTADPPAARILVVDDDASILEVARRVLTDHGYRVTVAENATEALDRAAGERFDLLLTDIVLPDLDGGSLAERVRQSRPTLPVLFMSGYAHGPDLAYEDGAMISKPFLPSALVRAVGAVLAAAQRRL